MGKFVAYPTVMDEAYSLIEHEVTFQQIPRIVLHKDTLVLFHLANIYVAKPSLSLLNPGWKF